MTGERETLEHRLRAKGYHGAVAKTFACPCCGEPTAPIELPIVLPTDPAAVQPEDPGQETFVCAGCLFAAIEAASLPVPLPTGWDSEDGNHLRAQRNMLIEQYAWTIRDDTPLDQPAREAFASYLAALHRMTITAATPADWTFPAVPEQTFMSEADYLTRIISKTE